MFKAIEIPVCEVETLYNSREGVILEKRDLRRGFIVRMFDDGGEMDASCKVYDIYEDAKDYAFGACALTACMSCVFAWAENGPQTLCIYLPRYEARKKTEG